MGDDLVLLQVIRTHLEVTPHQKLGEGEVANAGNLDNFPTVDVQDGLPEAVQDGRHVEALLVLW